MNEETILEVFEGLPVALRDYCIALWQEEGKGESIEAQVIKVADKLSLLTKCLEEVKAGNEFFQDIYDQGFQFLQEYNKPWWQNIKPQILL